MTLTAIAIATVVLSAVVYSAIFGGFAPGAYRERSCQGRAWRRAFPNASKQEIREFLSALSSSFAFRGSEKLKFGTSDELMSIYRELYGPRALSDGMELESFAKLIEKRYGVALEKIWKDNLTLGEVFSCTQKQ